MYCEFRCAEEVFDVDASGQQDGFDRQILPVADRNGVMLLESRQLIHPRSCASRGGVAISTEMSSGSCGRVVISMLTGIVFFSSPIGFFLGTALYPALPCMCHHRRKPGATISVDFP